MTRTRRTLIALPFVVGLAIGVSVPALTRPTTGGDDGTAPAAAPGDQALHFQRNLAEVELDDDEGAGVLSQLADSLFRERPDHQRAQQAGANPALAREMDGVESDARSDPVGDDDDFGVPRQRRERRAEAAGGVQRGDHDAQGGRGHGFRHSIGGERRERRQSS